MRNFILTLLFFNFFITDAFSQVPQAIPYQAVARSASGSLLVNDNIGIRFTIRDLSAGGNILYRELHFSTTDQFGLFSLNVGTGSVDQGTFAGIDWSTGSKFLQVEIDTAGGSNWTDMGSQQLMSVPYALMSASSNNMWNINGNSNLNDTTSFIGNLSSGVLNFRVNNQKAGKIDMVYTNTFFGYLTGNASSNGYSNTGFGNKALAFTTTGNQNTAIGDQAMYYNVASVGNVAVGFHSQYNANDATFPSFSHNTSIGHSSLAGSANPTNNTGTSNCAIGAYSLYNNSSGSSNTAVGVQAMMLNTTGNSNTAIGVSVLNANLTGVNNVGLGMASLYNNKAGHNGVAVGSHSQFNANNTLSAWDNTNTSVGYKSLEGSDTPANNTGINNTAVGRETLLSNSSGSENTAIGHQTLYLNTTGGSNTAVGEYTLRSNLTGESNIGVGVLTLYNNKAGSNGIAIGVLSQYNANNSTSPWDNTNTSVGYAALQGSTNPANNTGIDNTAIGRESMLLNRSGSSNTAVGMNTMLQNTTGNANTAVGTSSLFNNTAGSNNTAIGFGALQSNQGINNTAIGYGAGMPVANASISNATAIGANASVTVSNALVLGNNANVGIGLTNPTNKLHLGIDNAVKPTTNTWTIISDSRLKTIDGVYTKGLKEILELKPLLFHYKNTGDVTFDAKTLETQATGLLAQDVQKVFPECVTTDANGYLNLNIHAILIAQINAIQELEAMVRALQEQNVELKKEMASKQ